MVPHTSESRSLTETTGRGTSPKRGSGALLKEDRRKPEWENADLRQFVRRNCLYVHISVVMHGLYLVLEILSFALH